MTPVMNTPVRTPPLPRVLVVDDEPDLIELVSDVLGRGGKFRLLTACDLSTAKKVLESETVDLMVVDLTLPDGDGMSLLATLQEKHPNATAIVITGNPSVPRAIHALRAGVFDFLPKPFSADALLERINQGLNTQMKAARTKVRLKRLRGAVKKLNVTRHTISKKVDLLCNDLVAAYGELSRQIDSIRMQESFRKLLLQAQDLEQLLCHAMDWILRQSGYCNVAVWLAGEQGEFELGAYMKYTIPGEQGLTDAMRNGLVPLIAREGHVHLFGPEIGENLTPQETKLLAGQEIMGVNCTYLGESLGVIAMFRDEKSPFTEEDVAMLRAISPIFAVTLAGIVRRAESENGEPEQEDGSILDEEQDHNDQPRKNKNDSADWWKRGEPPPF